MIMNLIHFNLVLVLFFYIFILMIQLLLIVSIIICLIVLFLKTKEKFDSDLPSIDTLKATGGNKGIKLTWIKPYDTVDRYYILLFSKSSNKSNVYLYDNTDTLLEYHIKNIPNNNTYNVGIIYKNGQDFSSLYMYNYNGNEDIITDKNSPLNFSDFEDKDEEEEYEDEYQEESNKRCESDKKNVNMELQNIIKILTEKKDFNHNYNINLL